MLLFVDETETDEFFLVGGFLVESRESATSAYKHFKRRISNFPLSPSDKAKVYTEFKSVILDKSFQRIKLRMLEEIDQLNGIIIFSSYVKKDKKFSQAVKEDTYISLLSRIVASITDDISIIFDTFNMFLFEEKIVRAISKLSHVQAIMSCDSQAEPGLQFIDNICSVLRRYKATSQKDQFYMLIEKHIKEV